MAISKKINLKVNNKIKSVPKPLAKEKTAKNKQAKLSADEVKTIIKSTKQEILIGLLERPSGATTDEMAKATGWQRHSVQGMISGILKKKLKLSILACNEERGRVYRITKNMDRL